MKMKKLMALGLAVTMMAGLAGCSTPTSTVETTQATTQAAAESTAAGSEGTTAAEATTAAPTASTTGGKVFRYAIKSDFATFDPDKTNSVDVATLCYHIYDGLYRNVQGDIQPAVAEKYEVSDDNLTYTFHLRKDAQWSDGVGVTAKDYEYGLKRLMNPDTAAPSSFLGAILKNGDAVSSGQMAVDELGVKAIDDYTLEITLDHPAEYFLGMLSMSAFAPVRQDLVEKYGQDFCAKPENQVYNGPFVVTSYGNGKTTLAKNDKYYDADKIKLDGVEVLTVAESNTQVSMFDAGELDMVSLSTDLAPQYEGKYLEYYDGGNDYAAFNHNNKYLANQNLRLAMNYAINREEYILLSHSGLYEANQRYVLPQVHGVNGEYGTEYPLEAYPLQGDMTKAKDYLDQALSELGLSSPSDITLKLVVSDTEAAKKEAEVLANQWKTNLGINIDINMVPYKTKNAMLTPDNNEYDIIMSGWAPDYSDPYSYLELWIGNSSYNYLNYHSDAYDKFMEDSKTTTGEERMKNLFNAEKTLLEDGALAPLQLRKIQYMVGENVTGLEAYFVGLNFNYMYADIAG